MEKELIKNLSETSSEKEKQKIRDELQWYNEREKEIEEYLCRRKLL
ncbi:hypothetical protein IKO50_05425 [bacterium]|nr:hypothetical protein [bacterium]